jgi:hypothetical protein
MQNLGLSLSTESFDRPPTPPPEIQAVFRQFVPHGGSIFSTQLLPMMEELERRGVISMTASSREQLRQLGQAEGISLSMHQVNDLIQQLNSAYMASSENSPAGATPNHSKLESPLSARKRTTPLAPSSNAKREVLMMKNAERKWDEDEVNEEDGFESDAEEEANDSLLHARGRHGSSVCAIACV